MGPHWRRRWVRCPGARPRVRQLVLWRPGAPHYRPRLQDAAVQLKNVPTLCIQVSTESQCFQGVSGRSSAVHAATLCRIRNTRYSSSSSSSVITGCWASLWPSKHLTNSSSQRLRMLVTGHVCELDKGLNWYRLKSCTSAFIRQED